MELLELLGTLTQHLLRLLVLDCFQLPESHRRSHFLRLRWVNLHLERIEPVGGLHGQVPPGRQHHQPPLPHRAGLQVPPGGNHCHHQADQIRGHYPHVLGVQQLDLRHVPPKNPTVDIHPGVHRAPPPQALHPDPRIKALLQQQRLHRLLTQHRVPEPLRPHRSLPGHRRRHPAPAPAEEPPGGLGEELRDIVPGVRDGLHGEGPGHVQGPGGFVGLGSGPFRDAVSAGLGCSAVQPADEVYRSPL
mmetsp:Transcript_92610/g.247644  ORF Transcript_92610/g.247644 Transcript_92610/m.247644 type:complete len:246 (-) Transcript_92610:98-835(-)